MSADETFGTKLWIERHERRADIAPSKSSQHEIKSISLTSKEILIIKKAIKLTGLSWQEIIHTSYAILLSRLSTADAIIYGSGCYNQAKKNDGLLVSDLSAIKVALNEKISCAAISKKLNQQLSKKKTSSKLPTEVRYLLLEKQTDKKKEVHTDRVDAELYPLILLTNHKDIKDLSIAYHPTILTKDDASFLVSHLKVILNNVVTDTKQLAAYLEILTPSEKKKVLHEWPSPAYPFNMPNTEKCAHELVAQYARNTPHALAVHHNNSSMTYHELDLVSTNLAGEMLKRGVEPGHCVCLYMERSPLWIAAMLAIFKTGAIYVPINPKFPAERVEYVLDDCSPKLVFVDNNTTRIPDHFLPHKLNIHDVDLFASTNKNIEHDLPVVTQQDTAYLLYTSGTTGAPKGVLVKHIGLNNLIGWYQACFRVNPHDRSVQFASQGFDSHLCEIIPFLGSGASVHIVDDNIKLTPTLFFEWMQENNITVCDIPTAYAQILFSMTWPEPIKLRLMKIGGEALTRYPDKNLPFQVWNGYGPTEATVEATYFQLPEINYEKKNPFTLPPPSIGKPIVNNKVYIVDQHLQPTPIGVAGEILIGGAGVAIGYLNRESLTHEKFIQNPFNDDPNDKLYRTGDLGRWLKDGNIDFIGRKDNQVKLRGYRIELGEIENALSQFPDISEAVALVKETVDNNKSLVAYIVPNLDKERFLYQERCLLSLDKDKYIEAVTDDISKGGIALNGVSENIPVGKIVHLHLKLPGLNDAKDLTARLIWQHNERCGFIFDCPDDQLQMISKSIDYYLSSHNVMEMVLSAQAKRNLKKALKSRLPEYMIPSTLITLMDLPLTFSGKVDVKSLPPPQEYEKILHHEYIAPKTETEKKLVEIWHELLGKDKISMSDNFFDLGGTSLSAAILSVKILNRFNLSVPTKILFDLSYIPILGEFIDSRGEQYSKQSMIQEDIQRDCILPENITPSKRLIPTAKNPQNILLTGAGGFLGIYLLRDILQNSTAKVYCLIRKGEFDTAAKRLMATIKKFDLGNDISLNDRRIIAIAADLSANNFGLPVDQYNSLLDKVDIIYHCGAQVNIMASYNKLRGSNVMGTVEVIKFATSHYDKPIHYISTLSSAYQKDSENQLSEVFPEATYDEISGGYAISKWAAERLLTEAKNRGLPVQIYRSGYISGQSDNGQANLNDALFMLMKGCIQLGFAPNMPEKVTILPVDYVSRAIVGLSLSNPLHSTVYHIDHPTGIMWPDLIDWINDYGYHVKMISIEEWKKMLPSLSQDNALFPFLPHYLSLPNEYEMVNVNVSNATEGLKKINLPYPTIDNALLSTYFDYMRKEGFLPPKNKEATKMQAGTVKDSTSQKS